MPLSAFSSPSDSIPCSPSDHEVEIHDELCPYNQKTQHYFHIGLNLPCLVGSGDIFETYCE